MKEVIILDISKINSYVFPNIDKAYDTMQNSYNNAVNLKNNLPSSFSYKSTVSDIVNKINTLKSDINKVEKKLKVKVEQVEKIEKKNDSQINKIIRKASALDILMPNINKINTGAKTSKFKGDVVDKIVGKKIKKSIFKTGAAIAKSVVSKLKKTKTNIINKMKFVGTKVYKGVKTVLNKISKSAKVTTDWIKKKFNETSDMLKSTGAYISEKVEVVKSYIADKWARRDEIIKRLGAGVVTTAVSLTKGIVKVVESFGDLLVILMSGLRTIKSAILDIINGIFKNKWDWKNTKEIWDITKGVVSTDWTNMVYDSLYKTKALSRLNDLAYTPFKKDGIACQITEGLGYVGGIIGLTLLTGGLGLGASLPQGVSMAVMSGLTGFGKYTEEEWNKNVLSINYLGEDLELKINYDKYKEINSLKPGESTIVTENITLEDGSIKQIELKITLNHDGTYTIVDNVGNAVILNEIKESSTAKGLGVGLVKGAWEAGQWYIGSKIGTGQYSNITSKFKDSIQRVLARTGIRVGLDSLTAAVEVPFQSIVTMVADGKTFKEAWEEQGGWTSVISQVAIGALASTGGEIFDIRKVTKSVKLINALESGNIDDALNKKLSKLRGEKLKVFLETADSQGKLDNVIDKVSKKELDKVLSSLNSKTADNVIENLSIRMLNKIKNNNVDKELLDSMKNLEGNRLVKILETANLNEQLMDVMPYLSFDNVNNIMDSLDVNIKKIVENIDAQRKVRLENSLNVNIYEENKSILNIFWFDEIFKPNIVNDKIINVNSFEDIPYYLLDDIDENLSLKFQIGDKLFDALYVKKYLDDFIKKMDDGDVEYSKQLDYWYKQYDILKNEQFGIYKVENTRDFVNYLYMGKKFSDEKMIYFDNVKNKRQEIKNKLDELYDKLLSLRDLNNEQIKKSNDLNFNILSDNFDENKFISEYQTALSHSDYESIKKLFTNLNSSELEIVLNNLNNNDYLTELLNFVIKDDILYKKLIKQIKDGNLLYNIYNIRRNIDGFDNEQLTLIAENLKFSVPLFKKFDDAQLEYVVKNMKYKKFSEFLDNCYDDNILLKTLSLSYSPERLEVISKQLFSKSFNFKKNIKLLMDNKINIDSIVEQVDDIIFNDISKIETPEFIYNLLKYISNTSTKEKLVSIFCKRREVLKMISEDYSAGKDVSSIIGSLDKLELVNFIEGIDIKFSVDFIKKLSKNKYTYVVNNLEGILKNKLALEYNMVDFYDQKMLKYEKFANNDMRSKMKSVIGKFVGEEKIDNLNDTFILYTTDRFVALDKGEKTMAFNNGKISVMNSGLDELIVVNCITHESLHQLSFNSGNSGFLINGSNRGFNECATEFLNEIIMGDEYYTKANNGELYCAYQEGVEKIKDLMGRGIINRDKFIESYFNNDMSYVESEITALIGKEKYDELIDAFDNAIGENKQIKEENLDKLDKIIQELDKIKWGGQ